MEPNSYPYDTPTTKEELLAKIRAYAENPDDDVLRFKDKIKDTLLKSPEFLYALNWDEYESELINGDGTINEEGEWDRYFNTAIKPYYFMPDTQKESRTFVTYGVSFNESPRYNEKEYYYMVTFNILSHANDSMDEDTGYVRADLIASILRENFAWSNIFGTQCRLTQNREITVDSQYSARVLVFEGTMPNALYKTTGGKTYLANTYVRQ